MDRVFALSARKGVASRLLTAAAAVLLLLGFAPVAGAKGVSTSLARPSNVQPGTYSVHAYGCNSTEDVANVAVLQKEGTPYSIGLAPRSRYFGKEQMTLTGLNQTQALAQAKDFVQCNANAIGSEVSAIHAPDGQVIGYEVTPVFRPLAFGSTDPVDTRYSLKGDRIIASIDVDPLAKMDIQGGG